jgi:hypothetical protein
MNGRRESESDHGAQRSTPGVSSPCADPFAEMDREDREDRERDRKRAEYEARTTTIELIEEDGCMVPVGGAQLSESELGFWRRCDVERRRQADHAHHARRQVPVPRRPTCCSRPRARGRRERAARSGSTERGKPRRSGGDDEPPGESRPPALVALDLDRLAAR